MTRCHSSTVMSATGVNTPTPALLIRMSRPPNCDDGLRDGALDVRVLTNVSANAQDVLAERRNRGVDVALISACDRHRCATRRKRSRRGQSDPSRATSNECNFSCE